MSSRLLSIIVFADGKSKGDLFRSRFDLLLQRTLRHELFTPEIAGEKARKKYKLKTVEFLVSTTSRLDDVVALGMLTQVRHGVYSLEDPSGAVPLDLSEAKFNKGLFTENCFVLVEGWYDDGTLHVGAMGFPPAETAEASRDYFGGVNFFGGPLEVCAKKCPRLKERLNCESSDAAFIILSDVWLDRAEVVDGLRKLFIGYCLVPPTAFILMGNFLSSPHGSRHALVLKEKLKMLGELISEYQEVHEECQFLFVSGPSDPGYANIYPRPAMPDHITEDLRALVPKARFVSNPCRVQFCTREMVIFREDIVTKMCRNCIYFPEEGDIPSHFARTLTCQAHLAPLPQHVSPVYWDFDRSMYLYPLPDLVVAGDKFDPFTAEDAGCRVVNPGSFGKNEFNFKCYHPRTGKVDDCQLPEDL